MKLSRLLLAACMFVTGSAGAQSSQSPLSRIIPPAPEAASISKYGIYPVSMFTGLPEISIPLYEIGVGEFSLPISLDYHAAGIKVDDLASSVGLGWNINAGGVITRTVVGVPDDASGHGMFDTKIKREHEINETDYARLVDILNSETDSEPDMFSFNFGNYSGKFVFSPDGKVHMMPYNNLKVTYQKGLFAITDSEGIIYKFEKTAWSTQWEGDNFAKYFPTTSWYLSTILLPNKVDSITFTYTGYTPGRMEILDYQLSLGKVPVQTIANPGCGTDYQAPCTYRVVNQSSTEPVKVSIFENYSFWYVESITFPGGKVNFSLSDTRLDYGRVLDNITVTNINGRIIKQFTLTHDYFYNDAGYNIYAYPQDKYRLKLTGLSEIGTSGTAPLKHTFQYNEQYLLPPRKNFGVDFWGYYNGKNANEQLIPLDDNGKQYSVIGYGGLSDVSNITKPADRTSDENYMKSEMLKRIYYPTGGYTDFDFEANSTMIQKRVEKPGNTIFVAAKKDDIIGDSTRYAYFIPDVTIPANAATPATLLLNIPLWSDIKKPEVIFQNLTKGTYDRYRTYPGDATFRTVNIALYAGDTYKVSTSIFPNPNDPNDDTDEDVLATVKWPSGQTEVIDVVQKGPGLRIKSIKSYTATGDLAKQEDYKYGENESGLGNVGFFNYLFSKRTYMQDYIYCYAATMPPDPTSINSFAYPATRMEILSRPLFSYSDFGGSSIFYPQVTKYEIGNGVNNGKTVYTYDYELDDKIEYNYPDPQLLVSAGWKSGNLLSEKKYKRKADGAYQLINETVNQYATFYIDTTYGLKVGAKTIWIGSGTCMPGSGTSTHTAFELNRDFRYFEYPAISGIKKVINVVNKNYSDDNVTMSASIDLTYNANFLPATTLTKNSKGEIVKEVDRYPADKAAIVGLTAAESIAIDTMMSRNMISTLIEHERFVGGISTGLSHFEYNLWGGTYKIVELKKNKVRIANGVMNDMYEIFGYDEHGNMLERAAHNGIHEVYLWGYNKIYPVAQIQNSTYNVVSSLVNNTLLQQPASAAALDAELSKLRNPQLLPQTTVITYTYEPLLGVTGIKDASGKSMSYEYDSFSRLKTVRDANGKILKFIDYQFQQPITK